ncbi:hypothetical protein GmHk_03G007191 [Glycine max]|nr:hypothetical protein GmHk_03G007191 [Glycine max]
MDVLALLIFGVVLFPNVDGLVDLAAIDAFLAYHHSKESPVVAVLADLFDTFDRRCEKSSARIICCLPALCVWLVSHLFQQDTRHPCPLLSHRSCTEKRRIDWDQLLAGIGGYPMRGAPTEESMSPFLVRDFGAQNSKTIQRIHKAWETPLRKDQELRGIRNGIIGGYHEWLKVHIRGLDWLAKLKVVSEESFEAPEEDEEVQALKSELGKAKFAKEKFKLAATHIRKECAGLREENAITARALEQETKRARKEEYGRNKFRGALWGSNSELKLRREERDQSRAHSMVLKEELIACLRSKRSLSQRLCETETNMLAIIAKYQEELGLATAHEHRIADEYAQVYTEKEARGRVIDSLHQEATMWMDRFALTLNGSQELPRLLAKAKAMADTYSTPEEIHGLLGYCQHMIDLMAHIIRNRYMPSSFADLVFAGERIEVGLKRGKFDYVSSTNANAKRIGATGAKRKEGDAHAVSSTPAWVKPQQTPHGTHQYAQHHPSFSAHTGNASSSTPVQPKAPTQREAPQVPTPNTTRPAGNSNTTRNFPPRPFPEFTPLPMTYEDLLPSLIANHLAVVTPRRVLEPPFPKWYDPNATCKYHGGVPGHSVEKCLALKYKVQHLMDAGWLTFQEDRPNVRTNPLANHGGGAVNAVESDRPHRSKPLRDVATPRRFIFEALQKGGVIPHSGCKEDSCLLHSGELHDMETCLGVEELLQRMIDQGRLEVGSEGKEEQHICMQSTEGSGIAKPKPLVIYFTKSAASQKPRHPLVAKPVPFPYQNSHAVPWRYTPPREKEEEATDVSSLSAKVTNITGLSGVTRSGRVFAPPDLPVQPADIKGKGKVVEEQDGEAPHASNKDIPAKGPPEKKDVMLGNGYEPGMGLGKDNGGITSLINTQGNRGKYGLGYKPTQADMKRSIAGRKNSGQSSRWRQESEGSPPCHISRSFISAGLGDKAGKLASGGTPRHLRNEHNEMAPRKLASKRSRKDKAAEGTSSAPEYDSHRFRSAVHQQRFEAIKGWSFLRERRVQLRDDKYTDFQEEIGRRRWTSLVTPMAKFDPEIAQGDAPQAAGAPPPPHQAGQAGAFDMEQYLRHLVRQQVANHRAHVQTHDCLYQMSLSMQSQGFASFSCPTPDQFRAEVAWPGDWPEAQAGEAPPEAPGDGEEAHEDEEMADLLDFLGGRHAGKPKNIDAQSFVDRVFSGFFRRFPQINVGGDSARIPFLEHASRESRVALPPKGRLRHYPKVLYLRKRQFLGLLQMLSLKRRFYQVKVKSLGTTSLKELGQLMGQLQRQAFRKAYGKI